MARFVSLLRGINVSGQKKIRMVDLKSAYEALGLTNVQTYVQSGNVVFDTKLRSAAKVATLLEEQIDSCFGFDVTVLIRTPADLQRIVKTNPFAKQASKEPSKVAVAFLAARPTAAMVELVKDVDAGGDEFVVNGAEVFLHCPVGFGRSKLSHALFERKFKMPVSARNWKTVMALHDLASGESSA